MSDSHETNPNLFNAGADSNNISGDGYIHLRVVLANQVNEVHFRVKPTVTLGKLKKSYADRMGLAVESLRFRFEGCTLQDHLTPAQLELEDDDIIEVYQKRVAYIILRRNRRLPATGGESTSQENT